MKQIHSGAACIFRQIVGGTRMELCRSEDYFLHVVSGALTLRAAGQEWLLPPSFAAWVPAQTPMQVSFRRPSETCSLLVAPGFAPDMPKQTRVFQMSLLARDMARHCKHWGPDAPPDPKAATFMRAFLDLCAELSKLSIDVRRPVSADPKLAQVLTYIEENIHTLPTAEETARRFGYSLRGLQRRFEQDLGESWSSIVTRLRMIRATQLLSETQDSVLSVSHACGFASLSAFNRAFQRFGGTTPSQFRKDLRPRPR